MGEALDPIETMDTEAGEGSLASPTQSENRSLPDPLEGGTLGPGGRYKILQRIGEGGFGTVFMAEQSVPVRRRVAIKILKAGMDTRQVVARFEAERQALAMMDHPNIAKVLDGGETERGRPFFVMELVRGTPITAFCDREKLDTRARLHLFLQVCRAVQHAHQKGIIHRDLKPGNILVTVQEGTEPVPKVIDFGVAKAMEANLTDKTLFTRFEQMIGTPAYMSPEQAGTDADATDIDTRADIYALGVLLYELLTGSTPFEAETLQHAAFDEIRRILREEDAPRPSVRLSSLEASRRQTLADSRNDVSPHSLDKQLRGDLDWIVMKAIEKDRRRRYETANALALDLGRYLKDDPVEARPPSTGYRLRKFARRHKPALATAATILIILVAASIISTLSAIRASKANQRSTENLADLQTAYTDLDLARGEAESQRNEAIWNEYVARQFPLREAWKERNFGHLERLLEELVPAPGQPDFRGWEWAYYKDQCEQAFTTTQGRLPVWNPADENLAVVRDFEGGGSAIVLISPHDGSLVRTLIKTPSGKEHRIYNFRWSGDGSRFAYLTTGGLAVVVDARTVRSVFERQIPTPQRVLVDEPEVRGLDLNHDGSLLVTGTWAGNIQLWNLDASGKGKLIQEADRNSHIGAHALRFDPEGKTLAGALRSGRRTTWNLETGEAFEYTPRSVTSSGTVAWDRCGKRFAVTDQDIDSVGIFQPGRPKPLATLSHDGVFGVSWIGDGLLATIGSDQIVRIWDAKNFAQTTTFHFVSETDVYRCSPVPSPTGKLLAVPGKGVVKITHLRKPIARSSALASSGPFRKGKRHKIEWDPKDQHLASWHEVMITPESWESKIRVWDSRNQSLICDHNTLILSGMAWDPDDPKVRLVVRRGNRLLELATQSGKVFDTGPFPPHEFSRMGFPSFSPNGRWLVLPFDRSAVCLDAKPLQKVASWTTSAHMTSSRSSRWHPNGRSVALVYWHAIAVWSPFGDYAPVEKGFPSRVFAGNAWSPDGKLIAVGQQDGSCAIFEASSLQEVATLKGHRGPVVDLDWSANGRLASASEDGTVRIWDDATGDELLVFDQPDGRKFLSVRWTHDGRRLAAGDEEGRIFIWESGSTEDSLPAHGLESGILARPR